MCKATKYLLWGDLTLSQHLREYAYFACFLVPLITLISVTLFSNHFLRSFAYSIVVAEAANFSCFWGGHLIGMAERCYFLKIQRPRPQRSKLFYACRSLIFLVPGMSLGFLLNEYIGTLFGYDWPMPSFEGYRFGMVLGLLSISIFCVLEMRQEAHEAKNKADIQIRDLEIKTMKAQIAALSAQMNPHLLFNALNTVISLIPEEPEKAEDLAVELSALYRAVLEAAKKDIHSLKEELFLCESYLRIEKARFGDTFEYSVFVEKEVELENIEVPVLFLQPLVENAFKHGIREDTKFGKVRLCVKKHKDGFEVKILDNGVGFGNSSVTNGSGSSVENCRQRLRLLYGDSAFLNIKKQETRGTEVFIRVQNLQKNRLR